MIKITPLSAPAAPVTRLRVEGRVVLRTAGELAKACHAALADGPPLLLDLSGVAFVDAEGAAAITALGRRSVTVVGCSPFIGALLRSHAERSDDDDTRDDDAGLARRLRAAHPTAFEETVRRHGTRLLAVARRMLRNEDDARDAVQEAFLSAWRGIATFQADAKLSTWLHRIVANAALMRLRTRRRKPEESIDALLPRFDETGHWAGGVPPLALPDDALDRAEIRAAVRRCIDRLPESFRAIVVLRDVEDLDTDEVARLLDTTASAVKSRLHRARQALRELLARELAPSGRLVDVTGLIIYFPVASVILRGTLL